MSRDYSNDRGAMCWPARTWRTVDIPVETWPPLGVQRVGFYRGPRITRAWVYMPPLAFDRGGVGA